MPWIYLGLAGLLEVAWAIGLKYSDGFSLPWPSLWTLLTMAASFWLLALAFALTAFGGAMAEGAALKIGVPTSVGEERKQSLWTPIRASGPLVAGVGDQRRRSPG